MKKIVLACSVGIALMSVSATDSVWKGADSAYLNDAANWEGDAPFSGTSSNNMKFKDSPSNAYTVKLSDDLVSAGSWSFNNLPVTLTWDLGGHSLTFLSGYSDHAHKGWTNIFVNGTIAYTNANGALQGVTFWNANSGAALFFGKDTSFIGNFKFQDTGTKTLDVRDGAQWKGNMIIPGIRSHATVTGEGTVVNVNEGTLSVGGNGDEALMEILDGAVVTNAANLFVGANEACVGNGSQLIVSNATLKLTGTKEFNIGGETSRKEGDKVVSYVSHQNVVKFIGGAQVDTTNSYARVGTWSSHSNLLYVADEGTTFAAIRFERNGWDGSDYPYVVGQNGSWNEIHVTDKATMLGGYLVAGGQLKNDSTLAGTTSLWNRITVDNGATLKLLGEVRAGWRHNDAIGNGAAYKSLFASNIVEISSGAQVIAVRGAMIGDIPMAFDNKMIVQGEGTSLSFGDSNQNLNIGVDGGSGNGVEIIGGATISGVNEISVGYGTWHYLNDLVPSSGSNNYFRIEKTSLSTASIANLGYYANGSNKIIVGDGGTLEVAGLRMYGFGQEVIVSNGIFKTKGYGLCPAYVTGQVTTNRIDNVDYKRDPYTQDDSGKQRFSFYEQGRIVKGQTYDESPFTNACVFAFHIPAEGYKEAAYESQTAKIVFSDDTEFEFDFDAVSKDGLRNVPLVAYTGGNTEEYRIVMSDELLAKINTAAAKAREGSKVRLSADRKLLTLRVGSAGFSIIVR